MLLHPTILFLTGLFTVGLILAARYAMDDTLHTTFAVVILSLIAAVMGRIVGRHFFFAIVPVTLAVAIIALLFFVDAPSQRLILILMTMPFIYGVILGSYRLSRNPYDATARGMVVATATASLFFFYAAIFAIFANFLLPAWWVAVIIFTVTTVITWQYFVMIAKGKFMQTIVYSIILGLMMTEAAIVAMYWPFGYLTISIVLLMIYYILWDLGQSFFLERLSKPRLVTNLVVFLLLAAVVFLTTPWIPLV